MTAQPLIESAAARGPDTTPSSRVGDVGAGWGPASTGVHGPGCFRTPCPGGSSGSTPRCSGGAGTSSSPACTTGKQDWYDSLSAFMYHFVGRTALESGAEWTSAGRAPSQSRMAAVLPTLRRLLARRLWRPPSTLDEVNTPRRCKPADSPCRANPYDNPAPTTSSTPHMYGWSASTPASSAASTRPRQPGSSGSPPVTPRRSC